MDILNQNINTADCLNDDDDSFLLELGQEMPSKRICLGPPDPPAGHQNNCWPEGFSEGDSIFSDVINSANNFCDNDDTNDCQDDPLQCTQRFIDDITSEDAELPKYRGRSQYSTLNDILQRQESHRSFLREAIESISDTTWETEIFPEEYHGFSSKGPFYGLPEKVERLLYEQKNITGLYDWQKECLQLPAIERRHNLIYALPTSGGKTLVAEILMLREILCREKNVMFVLPYVSIVQEKVGAMAPFAYQLDFLIEEYTAGKGRCPPIKRRKSRTIFICSIEKGAILFDSLIEANRANEIGLIVVDELHLIGEKGRGATLEALLTKAQHLKAGIQIVGMSATIGNLPEVAEFLEADVYTRSFRPVELKEFIKCGKEILKIDGSGKALSEIFVYERTVNFKYTDSITKSDPDHLAGLVSEVIPNGSCLIFCSTRKNCENVAVLLSKILSHKIYGEHKRNDRLGLMDAIEKLCGALSPVLSQTIPYGIAYHHSGLMSEERRLLEMAYRFGTLSVICCTSTLAAGVNLPAKRVIIRAPYVGMNFMTLCQYKQMIGRAGRAGLGEAGESILICSSKDNMRVGQMLFSPMDEVNSSMIDPDTAGLESLLLSAIGLKLAECFRDLLKLAGTTLLAVQSAKLEASIETEITSILRIMFRHKILKIKEKKPTQSINPEIITTQEIRTANLSMTSATSKHCVLSKSTKFELTTIGLAAYKAGVDYKKAEAIYHELKSFQNSLSLRNYTHLLYLVVSYNLNADNIYPNAEILFREYNRLDRDNLTVAKKLGITESLAVRMFKRQSVKGPIEKQLTRFFKVLILSDLIQLQPTHIVAEKFQIDRGAVQMLINQTVSATSSMIRLCGQLDEFWCYTPLFERLFTKLDYCCTAELAPLLDLPNVKINRAKQFYNAGYQTIEDIAKAKPRVLTTKIEHLPFRHAQEIVAAAKVQLMTKLEVLQEETDAIISCLQ